MSRRGQVAIPVPMETVQSLQQTAVTTKELVEVLAGQRGATVDSAVTWGDLVALGLITQDQVPVNLGQYPD